MMLEEKILIVFISVLLSSLVSIFTNRLFIYINNKKTIKCAEKNLKLFGECLKNSISNSNSSDIETIRNLLLSDYSIFSDKKSMGKDFKNLLDISVFFMNEGYECMPSRKEQDMLLINDVLAKY